MKHVKLLSCKTKVKKVIDCCLRKSAYGRTKLICRELVVTKKKTILNKNVSNEKKSDTSHYAEKQMLYWRLAAQLQRFYVPIADTQEVGMLQLLVGSSVADGLALRSKT